MKYSGEMYDVFDMKLNIFRDNCIKVGIGNHQLGPAFSIMLRGKAAAFYFQRICSNGPHDFISMVQRVRDHFENEESRQNYLSEWRETTFHRVSQTQPDKTKLQVLEALIEKLTIIQRALPSAYQSDEILRSQLVNACSGVHECTLCLYNPSPTLEGVINQLRSAVSTAMRNDKSHQYAAEPSDQYWVDRTYRGRGRHNRYGNNRGRGRGPPQDRSHDRSQPKDQKCYVCKRPGCWSTKHSVEERRQAYDRYKSNRYVRDTSSTGYGIFLAQYEGLESLSDNGDNEDIRQYTQATFTSTDNDDEDAEADGDDTFYVSTAFFNKNNFSGKALLSQLADQSVFHQLTKADLEDQAAKENAAVFTLDRYSAEVFQGILPDTGAAGFSTAGYPQVVALRRTHPAVEINTSHAGKANIRFGGGDLLPSNGTITVPTPFGPIDFHVVPVNTPFLLCLADMDRLRIRFDNLANTLQQGDVVVPIIRKWGHPWLLLGPPEQSLAWNHLTDVELRRLHRRFGHPSIQRLHKVLHEAGHNVEVAAIEKLTKYCHQCQMHGKSPGRFKFALRDDYSFNYEVIVDVMYLDGDQPALHVVDLATSFNAACFLKDVSAKTTWEALRLCWIDVYQGPPDWIIADAGRNFVAADFRREARAMSIEVKIIPVEAHHSIGKVERYHAALRRAYDIIRKESPLTTRESALQSAVKAINDTAGPDGIVPTLLVFGAYPRMTDDSAPSPDIVKRAAAVRKAGNELRKHFATRQVNEALAARNGPDTTALKLLAIGSQVRVWREKEGWTGPYRLLAADGEDCTVDVSGPRNFRSTVVKPYHADPDEIEPTDAAPDKNVDNNANEGDDHMEDTIVVATTLESPGIAATSPPLRRPRGRPRKTPYANALLQETDVPDNSSLLSSSAFISAKEESDKALAKQLRGKGVITTSGEPFELSTRTEIDSLIARGVFEFVTFDPAKHNGRIFKSRIVNEVKGKNTDKPYEKSRLVIQGYADDGKEVILTQSPTIQRASQRLILALTPSLLRDNQQLWLRDITQAYVQSTSQLNRTIYAHLPTQIRHNYPQGTIMKVVKPLYGIAEAGTHWWATYSRHHRENLEMVTSSYDPCLLLSSIDNPNFGLIGMQTDDTIGLTDAPFSAREDEELMRAAFNAKTKQYLTADDPLTFNGGIVSLTSSKDTSIILQQKGQGKKLKLVNGDSPTAQQEYVQQRARGAYIASICQPEACYDLSAAAQYKEPNDDAIKNLNRRLQWQMDSLDRGLTFIPLNLETATLFVFVDGSFANNHDLTSQLGFVVVLANETVDHDNGTFEIFGNIIHFSSTKSKRVTRSVLASEVYGMVAGVDMAYAISSTLAMITQRLGTPSVPTIACTDSYSLYECLVKLGTTKEKRLMIDIMALRQSYERRELCEVRWIHGDDNPADGFTKSTPNNALEHFITTNAATIRMEGWVTRE
ncbi:hypothetical protein CPLU01_15834 [Colletotrichum plurivorum]|uniref:Integrase catalytic domain-containing protein n=1 Tax=Colletotrichum plurivorum TaxID=2175906 RepID=A0A8H6J6V2_9PEZI|nr:hypothetical protein CPLU01_15834 [Colletotrichum plurivorum]